jgi:hypothetical protein
VIKFYGECIVTLVDVGTDAERVRVERADSFIMVSEQLINEWRSGRATEYVRLEEGGIFTFGTVGEGEGRVTYQLGERYDAYVREATRLA